MSIDAPLVGRDRELAELRDALGAARGGRPNAVLLAGDAGAGKTRLLQAFASAAAAEGVTVLQGHCVDFGAAGLPYLAFAEAVGAHLSGSGAAVPPALATLLGHSGQGAGPGPTADPTAAPTAGPTHAPSDDPGADPVGGPAAVEVGRMRLFEAVARYVGSLAATAPVLLVLEDLHWADPSSRDLLRYLLGRMRREQVLVVASYRSDDLHRSHPVRGLLGDLTRLPHVRRVELTPFGPAAMTEFLSALADGHVSAGTVRRVLERSEGNAYFAEELFAAGDRPGVPDGLAEVLLDRLERLSPAARQVARLAAVGGRRVADELLLAVSGLDRATLDEALREAVSAQVLRAEGERYAFRHALLQEAVYADLLPGERSRWHAAYVTALSTPGRHAPGSWAELAHHGLAAHDLPTALLASVRAAEAATDMLAPREALQHLERAIDLYDSVPDAEAAIGMDAVDLHRRAAGYASRCGRVERAVALARVALERAEAAVPAGGDPRRPALLHHRLAQHLIAAERLPEALGHARLAVDGYRAVSGDVAADRDHAWALAGLARALMLSDGPGALTVAEQAHRAAVDLGAPDVEADTLATLAVVHSVDGEVPDHVVDARLLQALERARESQDVLTELRASVNLAWNRYSRADVTGALTVLEAACDRAAATGLTWSPMAVELRVLRRVARYVAGRWVLRPDGDADLAPDTAAARLASASLYVQVGRGDDGADAALRRLVPLRGRDVQVQVAVDGCLSELRRWQGHPDQAADLARAATDDLARCHGTDSLGAIWFGAVEVAALADVADEAALRRDPDTVANLQRRAEERVEQAQRLYDTVLAAAPDGMHRPGPEALAWLVRGRAELARLPVAARLAGGGSAHDLAEQTVTPWREALAVFGYGYPFEQARCRLGLAAALLATSSRGGPAWREAEDLLGAAARTAADLGARPLAERVAALGRRAGVPVAPERDAGDGAAPGAGDEPGRPMPVGLTAREQDVLRLVAQGWTNRQVGAALFISEKTVSVHLSNVMAKLGASGRTEAVSLAHRAGLLAMDR
ncbi:AAA family ATPase [Jannaschia sp. R86511]|uniref:helix-turn-helix transcriptional regulator n=1 Tax=Jannaschia sp. R86511 TaxID=3093853 RepID=UPI0036D3EF44